MAKPAPSLRSLVLVPTVISLVVTVLRLVGELLGWNPILFSNVAPGAELALGLVGISWLIPIFGFWFGYRLRPKRVGRLLAMTIVGALVLVGGFVGFAAAGLITMPDKDNPGEPAGLPYSLAIVAVASVIAMSGSWRLGRVLLVYAFLARIPVVLVTALALVAGWDVHYVKLPAGMPPLEGFEKFVFLAMPQVTFWIAATIMAGGLFGAFGSSFARRSTD